MQERWGGKRPGAGIRKPHVPTITNEEIDEQLRQLADDTEQDDYPLTEQEANA